MWETRGERKDRGFFVNKTRQIGVGMTTNNTGRGRGRERESNTGEQSGDGPTYMPGGTRECVVRYYGQRSPVHVGLNVLGQS